MYKGIDLYSDTMTRPTAGMREAIASAEVGDEQINEDPTTQELERKLSKLLGFSGAVFLPTATMANEIALKTHCDPGNELIAWEDCHLFFAETGGPAVLAQVLARTIPSANGIFSGDEVKRFCHGRKGWHYAETRLVSIENTTNMGGGAVWSLDQLNSVVTTSKEYGLKLHMDGARFFHAVTALNVAPSEITKHFDSVTICLSKGLGCPSGAVLLFDQSLYPKVRRLKQLMGGALRQSGILAAAGIYALNNHLDRLKEDHENAQRLALGLGRFEGTIHLETQKPESNMVFFRWMGKSLSSETFLRNCREKGVRFSHAGGNRIRAVTHLDVNRQQIDQAIQKVGEVIADG